MGKETVKNTYVLQEDENIGTVQIADEVVAIIASLAATEVEGVSSMAGNITYELMSQVGVKGLTKGVKVEVFNHQVRAELAVLMEYGYNIPATSQKVQERVKNAIENMTGLTVMQWQQIINYSWLIQKKNMINTLNGCQGISHYSNKESNYFL